MGGIGVSQTLSPEHYPERGGDDEYYDVEEEIRIVSSEGLKTLGKGAKRDKDKK